MGRKYKCPYCEVRKERKDLITHIDKKHEELIPEGYSSTRVVYDMINNKHFGICRVCKKHTEWNEKTGRYDVLCGDPKCKEAMREEYKKNMLRVRGTYNILNDPEQQMKMLANRKISGVYKFADGGVVGYTGSYERKFLEFMDVVMQINSKDILSPGPTMEYLYNGKKHFYIPDFYYIPYNLIIEIKDGGENKNTKDTPGMRSSREKTIEKERVITNRGEYNYVRITDNNFAQIIEIFMELKEQCLNGVDKPIVKINESYGSRSNYISIDESCSNPEQPESETERFYRELKKALDTSIDEETNIFTSGDFEEYVDNDIYNACVERSRGYNLALPMDEQEPLQSEDGIESNLKKYLNESYGLRSNYMVIDELDYRRVEKINPSSIVNNNRKPDPVNKKKEVHGDCSFKDMLDIEKDNLDNKTESAISTNNLFNFELL